MFICFPSVTWWLKYCVHLCVRPRVCSWGARYGLRELEVFTRATVSRALLAPLSKTALVAGPVAWREGERGGRRPAGYLALVSL